MKFSTIINTAVVTTFFAAATVSAHEDGSPVSAEQQEQVISVLKYAAAFVGGAAFTGAVAWLKTYCESRLEASREESQLLPRAVV